VDPVSLIIGALIAGAARAAQGSAEDAVNVAYDRLKTTLLRRFAADPDKRRELERIEADPSGPTTGLEKAVTDSNAHQDEAALAAARALMEQLDPEGVARGVYTIRAGGNVQNVVVGDRNRVTFGGGTDDRLK